MQGKMKHTIKMTAGVFFLMVFLAGCVYSAKTKKEEKYFFVGKIDRETRELAVHYSWLPFHGKNQQIAVTLWSAIPHKTLHIKELSFEYNGVKYYILRDKKKRIPKMYMMENGFYVQSDTPVFPDLTFFLVGKIKWADKIWDAFDDLEMHESVTITITQIYSFDNEPLRTEEIPYMMKRIYYSELFGS
jgi:hypothetical protein